MRRTSTLHSYARRIDRVVTEIGDDLDRGHSLEELAGLACFSPFHFHRIYRAIAGETPDETVRRMRLHRAAVELIKSAHDIGRIARRAGYGSVAAFTRAFAARYGQPPAAFRRHGRQPFSERFQTIEEKDTMDVTIERTEPLRLVGLDHQGDYNAIGRTFERLSALAAAHGLIGPGTRMFGIYFDDPETVPAARLRSFAGLSATDRIAPPAPLRAYELPASTVAVTTFRGPYAELEAAYRHLYKHWLPTSGREPADIPCFEEYLNNPRELPPTEWLTRISLPLAG